MVLSLQLSLEIIAVKPMNCCERKSVAQGPLFSAVIMQSV